MTSVWMLLSDTAVPASLILDALVWVTGAAAKKKNKYIVRGKGNWGF